MIKKLTFFSMFVVFTGMGINAQCVDDGCGCSGSWGVNAKKPKWVGHNKLLENVLLESGYYTQKFNYDTLLFRVPLVLWVYTKNDGTGGATREEVKQMMTEMNHYNHLNNTGFLYYVRDVHFVAKNKHRHLGYYWEAPLLGMRNKEKGCVNVHIVDEIIKRKLFTARSIRGTYNIALEVAYVKRRSSATTLAHEVAHHFGLRHPHRNWNKGKRRQESVSRTREVKGLFRKGLNCEINGDGLSDTPAEPNLVGKVDNYCNYTGKGRDKWGEAYKPSTDNIMSYPDHIECRNRFTPYQVGAMIFTAKAYNMKEWDAARPENIRYRFDAFEPDNMLEMATELLPDSLQYHTFHNISAAPGKPNTQDSEDWVWFDVRRENDGLQIVVSKATRDIPEVEVSVFDKSGALIEKMNSEKSLGNEVFTSSKLRKGKYYVCVKRLSALPADNFSDYTLRMLYRNL